jgi:hypothetical protein
MIVLLIEFDQIEGSLAELKGNAPGGQKHQGFLLLPFIPKRDVSPPLGSFSGPNFLWTGGNRNNGAQSGNKGKMNSNLAEEG